MEARAKPVLKKMNADGKFNVSLLIHNRVLNPRFNSALARPLLPPCHVEPPICKTTQQTGGTAKHILGRLHSSQTMQQGLANNMHSWKWIGNVLLQRYSILFFFFLFS
jgi:hypothetical protein